MTRDDIIRMAREAGATKVDAADPQCWVGAIAFETDELERFAALVAAAELRRLHEEKGRLRIVAEMSTLLLAQRSALLEALKSTGLFLHHCWCDVQMNEYSFEKLNQQMAVVDAAIKAVEGEMK